MRTEIKVLHLDDNEHDYELIREKLKDTGLNCVSQRVKTRAEFLASLKLKQGDFNMISATIPSLASTSLKLYLSPRSNARRFPWLLFQVPLGKMQPIDMLKAGATDYVLKDRLSRLAPAVRRALAEAEERQAIQHAEQEMAQSEFKYRHLFESLGDAAFLLDPTSERVLDDNKEAERMLERTRSELIGLNENEFHSRSSMDQYRRGFPKTEQTPRLTFEGEVFTKTRREIPVSITVTPLILYERNLLLGLYSDLSCRKHLEQQLRQSQR